MQTARRPFGRLRPDSDPLGAASQLLLLLLLLLLLELGPRIPAAAGGEMRTAKFPGPARVCYTIDCTAGLQLAGSYLCPGSADEDEGVFDGWGGGEKQARHADAGHRGVERRLLLKPAQLLLLQMRASPSVAGCSSNYDAATRERRLDRPAC